MRKDQVDPLNSVVRILPDSKTPNGVSEAPPFALVVEAFKSQMAISGDARFCFPVTGSQASTRQLSRPFGEELCGEPRSPIFGHAIFGQLMPHG